MAVIEGGSGVLAEVGEVAAGALHVTSKPTPADGHYRLSVVTGTLAAALAANAVVFSARWNHASKLCLINYFKTRFLPLTPFTAATLTDHTSFMAHICTGFTAAHTGGAAVTLTGTALKLRQSMPATNFQDIRIATTAALGGGTVTPVLNAFAQSLRKGNRVNPAAATEETIMPTTDGLDVDFLDARHPIVLSQDTGIIVRNRTVWPAAGTGILLVEMGWSEADAY